MEAGVRRRLVNVSVAATSAVALALSWAGVVAADRDAGEAQTVIVVPPPEPGTELAGAPARDTGLVPAPQPVRRIVVVRESRAS